MYYRKSITGLASSGRSASKALSNVFVFVMYIFLKLAERTIGCKGMIEDDDLMMKVMDALVVVVVVDTKK